MLYEILHYFAPLGQPIGLLWFLLLVGALVLFIKKQHLGALFLMVAAILVSVLGSSFPKYLVGRLEQPYIRSSFDEIPAGDVVVLLGGGQHPSKHDLLGFNVNDAGDRILLALELVRRQKGEALVIGGPIHKINGQDVADGRLLESWLQAWEIPAAPVHLLPNAKNTHDEAVQTQQLAQENGWKKVVLVTSGYHMKRAEALFQTAGLEVIPAACDFQKRGTPAGLFNPIPTHGGFELMGRYSHELIGWWVYRYRGWIGPAPAAEKIEPQAEEPPRAPEPTPEE